MSTRSRGTNFSVAEEKQLCLSYITIGKDATVGTNQSGGTFWDRIWQDFEKGMGPGAGERTLRSLESKWASINAEVSKFVGAMATVKATPKSGESAEDQIIRATKAYYALQAFATTADESEEQSRPTKKKKPSKAKTEFRYLHCWRILETEPKWQTFRENGADQPSQLPSNPGASSSVGTERPKGVKQTKEDAKNTAAVDVTYKRLAAATASLAKSNASRVKALEEANHLVLFSTPIESLDDAGQRFFKLRRAAVLEALEAQLPTEVETEDANAARVERVPSAADGEVSSDQQAQTQ